MKTIWEQMLIAPALIVYSLRIKNEKQTVPHTSILPLPPSQPVGVIKEAIKNAILDGIIPNEYEAAKQFMLERAAKMGWKPVRG